MPYNDIFTNDVYQNEHDEDMTRKHPNYYKAIKTFFPEVYKLPEDEITPMIDILKNQGDTYDEAASLVKKHINQKQPQWNLNYLNPKPQTPPASGLRTSTQAEADMKQLQNRMNAQAEIRKRLNDYNNKGFYLSGDQWKDVAKAFGTGIYSGTENVVDGMTGGLYNYLDDLSGDETKKRYEELRTEAYQAGVGPLYDTVQFLNRKFGSWIPLATIGANLKFK